MIGGGVEGFVFVILIRPLDNKNIASSSKDLHVLKNYVNILVSSETTTK